MEVRIQTDRLGKIPEYAHPGDAGFDFRAAIDAPIRIWPGERKMIPTGLRMAIPDGYEVQVRSRSGLSYKNGVVVANAPGTIDSGYRGELCVILQNLGIIHSPSNPVTGSLRASSRRSSERSSWKPIRWKTASAGKADLGVPDNETQLGHDPAHPAGRRAAS